MAFPSFDTLAVTTMTLVLPLTGEVNLPLAFNLLPLTRLQYTAPRRQKKRFKIPHCPIPGSILSLRYLGHTRGIIRSQAGTFFKNSITLDLATQSKNISSKLSATKIQMCGANSVEQGQEGAGFLLHHLFQIQDELDYIQQHLETARTTLEWLKSVTRGPEVKLMVSTDTGMTEITEFELNHDLTLPETETYDRRIATFLLRAASDYVYHNALTQFWDYILTQSMVITRPCEVKQVDIAMINYNYNLNIWIKRFELARLINGVDNFTAKFRNDVDYHVTIERPYEGTERTLRKKKKAPVHTLLAYHSGKITQSGPDKAMMRDVYNRFRQFILEIWPQIAKPKLITLEYVPVRSN